MEDYQNLNGNIILFPTVLSHIHNLAYIVGLGLGAIACLWLLVTNVSKEQSSSTKLILSTIFADFLVSSVTAFISIHNEIQGGFGLGQIGCFISYSFMVPPSCISIATLGVVAWDRYQGVCIGNQWSDQKINRWIVAIWITSIFITLLPFISSNQTTIHLETTSVNCSVRWFDRTAVSILVTALILLMATISFSIAIFSYYNVYNTYWNLTKNKKAKQDNQRIVFYKCVAMTISLVVLWSPYYVKLVYEFITGKSVGADLSGLTSIVALFCPALDPIILCYYDNRVKENMFELVRFKSLYKKNTEDRIGSNLERGVELPSDTRCMSQ